MYASLSSNIFYIYNFIVAPTQAQYMTPYPSPIHAPYISRIHGPHSWSSTMVLYHAPYHGPYHAPLPWPLPWSPLWPPYYGIATMAPLSWSLYHGPSTQFVVPTQAPSTPPTQATFMGHIHGLNHGPLP